MYNATLYKNTGFNAINIPDSKATLDLATTFTVPALDIYQARELTQFVVRGTYAQLKDVDYLLLQNADDNTDFAFYSVQNVTMTSKDTAVLDVTMDYILTAGGASNLQFLDGICERHHVAKTDDDFASYQESDPYLSPAETLQIETATPNFKGSDSDDDVVILESTIDLYGAYLDGQANTSEGIDYTSTGSNVVTVPNVRAVRGDWATATMEMASTAPWYVTRLPNLKFTIANPYLHFPSQTVTGWLPSALSYVRSLGVESCIIAQYAIPYFMIKNTVFQDWSGTAGGQTIVGRPVGDVGSLHGTYKAVDISTLNYERTYTNYTVQNKRLFYGDNCKYHIVSIASGNEAEFLPEEIYDNDSYPTVEMRVDPRPNGCPYFRFDVYRGDTSRDMFFVNAVKGLTWQNAPLVFEGASGSLMNQYKFNAQRAITEEGQNFAYQQAQIGAAQREFQTTVGRYEDVFGGIAGLLPGNDSLLPNVAAPISGLYNGAMRTINNNFARSQYNLSKAHMENSYNIQKNAELQSLLIGNQVVAPSFNFPISEGIRDYVGNTCIVYRTYYSDNDIRRLDKILNMYGYRHTVPITSTLLTNRSKFNYIQAKGVSIKNTNLPKWLRDGVATQFATGTRIWHQLPDINAYTDGTNI